MQSLHDTKHLASSTQSIQNRPPISQDTILNAMKEELCILEGTMYCDNIHLCTMNSHDLWVHATLSSVSILSL